MRMLALIAIFTKTSLLRQLAFRASFWLAVMGKVLRLVVQVLILTAIFTQVPLLGHWTFDQMLLIVATFNLMLSLGVISFHRNLMFYLPEQIRDGRFDFLLTKPVSPLARSAFETIDFMDLLSTAAVIILWAIALSRLGPEITWPLVLTYIVFLIAGYLFYFSLFLIAATLAFWTITGQGAGRFMEGVIKLASFPPDVLGSPLGFALLYVLPIALVAVVPSQVLLGLLNPLATLGFLLLALIWFIAARAFWRLGLEHYSSASS